MESPYEGDDVGWCAHFEEECEDELSVARVEGLLQIHKENEEALIVGRDRFTKFFYEASNHKDAVTTAAILPEAVLLLSPKLFTCTLESIIEIDIDDLRGNFHEDNSSPVAEVVVTSLLFVDSDECRI
jgi:hypothetical protein